jgi:hypothetical protein
MSNRKSGLRYNVTRQLEKVYLDALDLVRHINPQFGYRESDVIIPSFPKSGRNWVVFLLANSIVVAGGYDTEIHFLNSSEWISTTVPKTPPVEDGYPRIAADHGEYAGQDTRAIYILRHPADVMESYYVYQRDRWNEPVGEFSEFIRDNKWGVPAWKSHVESWESHIDVLVTFEGLKRDPGARLREMYTLFERTIDDETVEKAVKRSSFENMARMEEKYGIPEKHGANNDFTFMRQGDASQGTDYFDDDDYRYLWERAGDVMDRYEYEVALNLA